MENVMSRARFEQDLKALNDATLVLGEQAATAVSQAIQAFQTSDLALATRIVEEDSSINRLERGVLASATSLLLLQAPVAQDLRLLLGVSRIASNFERVGDHARDMARTVLRLAGAPPVLTRGDVQLMAGQVQTMLRECLRCLEHLDTEQAQAVCLLDDGVDAAYAALFRDVLNQMVEDPTLTARGTHTLFVGHDLERIGDYITNVAEAVIYIVTGETVDMN
jgi:phosphate transport system protein